MRATAPLSSSSFSLFVCCSAWTLVPDSSIERVIPRAARRSPVAMTISMSMEPRSSRAAVLSERASIGVSGLVPGLVVGADDVREVVGLLVRVVGAQAAHGVHERVGAGFLGAVEAVGLHVGVARRVPRQRDGPG